MKEATTLGACFLSCLLCQIPWAHPKPDRAPGPVGSEVLSVRDWEALDLEAKHLLVLFSFNPFLPLVPALFPTHQETSPLAPLVELLPIISGMAAMEEKVLWGDSP